MADMKCKDTDHVIVVDSADAGGDGPGDNTISIVRHGTCRNDPTYSGRLYVITRHGKLGMQMFPALALVMPARLRAAADMGNTSVWVQHNVNGLKQNYRQFTPDGARDLAGRIEVALATA